MEYNYHNHTYRCGHACGTEREYIETALRGGIRRMGFSDHIPLLLTNGLEENWRVPTALAEDYISTLRALREEYADRIEIHIGFESEYYPSTFKKTLEDAIRRGAEYLILGQHYLGGDPPMGGFRTYIRTNDTDILRNYTDTVIEAMETGVFTYVAHPDIMYAEDDALGEREATRLCEAAKRLEIPLELNFLGIRQNRHYPNERFWRVVGQTQAPVTFGFDAHTPDSAYDTTSLAVAKDMVARCRLNYIGEPTLIPLVR